MNSNNELLVLNVLFGSFCGVFLFFFAKKIYSNFKRSKELKEEVSMLKINNEFVIERYKQALKAYSIVKAQKSGIRFEHTYDHDTSFLMLSNDLEKIISGFKNEDLKKEINSRFNLNKEEDNLKLSRFLIENNLNLKKTFE